MWVCSQDGALVQLKGNTGTAWSGGAEAENKGLHDPAKCPAPAAPPTATVDPPAPAPAPALTQEIAEGPTCRKLISWQPVWVIGACTLTL